MCAWSRNECYGSVITYMYSSFERAAPAIWAFLSLALARARTHCGWGVTTQLLCFFCTISNSIRLSMRQLSLNLNRNLSLSLIIHQWWEYLMVNGIKRLIMIRFTASVSAMVSLRTSKECISTG